MSLYRYRAVALTEGSVLREGEIAGLSPADVRARLRRGGLQVLEVRPVATRSARPLFPRWEAHRRRQRLGARAELYDGLATLLESGTPLLGALETLLESERRRRSARRELLTHLAEALRSGESLAAALSRHTEWFSAEEVAIVAASEQGGHLTSALRTLASRHERSSELESKLVAAWTYPAIVACVAMGAFVFLSHKTLPELCTILRDAKVEIPGLTAAVMASGQFLVLWGLPLLAALTGLGVASAIVAKRLGLTSRLRVPTPGVLRSVALARLAQALSDLLRAGVPLVEALRVLAPSVSNAALRQALHDASQHVERGGTLAASLWDPRLFDAEFRRLVELGEDSGELATVLTSVGLRRERQAQRAIDRLASLAEPAAILVLASLIGLVAMAAVLPLVKLQEVL